MRPRLPSEENGAVVRKWRRLLPGPKHGLARGVAVFGSQGYSEDAEGLSEHLGRWPALTRWAESHGLELSGVPEDLPLLDREIGAQPHDAVMTALVGEVGLFLGTVIIDSAAGARWRVWPNGHPVIVTASGRELDVVALVDRSFGTEWIRLTDIYADAIGDGKSLLGALREFSQGPACAYVAVCR
jgi:hypothetical protein